MLKRLLLVLLLVLASTTTLLAQDVFPLNADIIDAEGNVIGQAQLIEDGDTVTINVTVEGLEPGEHGIHIHETGACEPTFDAAGDHFNPTNAEHGLNNPNGPHAGDLENMVVADDGTATYETTTDRIMLSAGDTSLFDADGSALVIHANADDQVTDPSGNSGDPVACAVLAAADDAAAPAPEATPEAPPEATPEATPETDEGADEATATPEPAVGAAPDTSAPGLPATGALESMQSIVFVVLALALLIGGSLLKPRRRTR